MDRNIDIYQTALKTSGFDGTITYNDQSEQANNLTIEEANQLESIKGLLSGTTSLTL